MRGPKDGIKYNFTEILWGEIIIIRIIRGRVIPFFSNEGVQNKRKIIILHSYWLVDDFKNTKIWNKKSWPILSTIIIMIIIVKYMMHIERSCAFISKWCIQIFYGAENVSKKAICLKLNVSKMILATNHSSHEHIIKTHKLFTFIG